MSDNASCKHRRSLSPPVRRKHSTAAIEAQNLSHIGHMMSRWVHDCTTSGPRRRRAWNIMTVMTRLRTVLWVPCSPPKKQSAHLMHGCAANAQGTCFKAQSRRWPTVLAWGSPCKGSTLYSKHGTNQIKQSSEACAMQGSQVDAKTCCFFCFFSTRLPVSAGAQCSEKPHYDRSLNPSNPSNNPMIWSVTGMSWTAEPWQIWQMLSSIKEILCQELSRSPKLWGLPRQSAKGIRWSGHTMLFHLTVFENLTWNLYDLICDMSNTFVICVWSCTTILASRLGRTWPLGIVDIVAWVAAEGHIAPWSPWSPCPDQSFLSPRWRRRLQGVVCNKSAHQIRLWQVWQV